MQKIFVYQSESGVHMISMDSQFWWSGTTVFVWTVTAGTYA